MGDVSAVLVIIIHYNYSNYPERSEVVESSGYSNPGMASVCLSVCNHFFVTGVLENGWTDFHEIF